MKKNRLQMISKAAIAITIAVATMVPAAAEAPDDLYVTDGNSSSYGNSYGIYIDYDEDYKDSVNEGKPEKSHIVSFYMRTGDKGRLEFDWARVTGRDTLGGENVPGVTLPDGWYLDGYYIYGKKYSAGELAGYLLNTPTLDVEVRTYPSESNSGNDDRDETYTITYQIRSGNRGELTFERTTVTGYGSCIPYADIPTLTDRFASNYSISGYYVDGVKYSRSELARLEITGDMEIEIRTYRDTGSENTGWNDEENGYEWDYDLGNTLKPCGCLYDCSHTAGYNGGIQYSRYGGMYIGGYYYPAGMYYSYPYIGNCVLPVPNSYTVTFNPQTSQGSYTAQVWKGARLCKPATPYCPGYTFLGWSTSKDGHTGYWQFDRYTVNQNLTLYGIWKKEGRIISASDNTTVVNADTNLNGYYTVMLQPNNGASYTPVLVKRGNRISINGTPKCAGYRFVGWAKDKDGEEMWDFEKDKVTEDTILYGVWRKL